MPKIVAGMWQMLWQEGDIEGHGRTRKDTEAHMLGSTFNYTLPGVNRGTQERFWNNE